MTIRKLLCMLGIHAWKMEELMYSVFRKCKICPKQQYMNFHPAGSRRWESLTVDYERSLRARNRPGGF